MRVISHVRHVDLVSQFVQPADLSLEVRSLEEGDGVVDTGQPVSDQSERSHHEDEHGGSVLGVLVNTTSDAQ